MDIMYTQKNDLLVFYLTLPKVNFSPAITYYVSIAIE